MSAPDDFFGIEYMHSASPQSGKKDEEKEEGERSMKRYSVVERRELSEMNTEKMSGTQFIDAAFFPELKEKKDEENEWRRGEEGTKNIWEEQYFQRRENDNDQSRMTEVKEEKNSEKRLKERKQRVVMSESQSVDERKPTGLDDIRSQFFPFWTLNEDQLIEELCERVVFNDGEMLAINKPKGMAYSGEKNTNKYQLDRMSLRVKDILLPKAEKLHPVLTLDKDCSGIVLFTTNHLLRSELVERIKNGEISIKTDCVVRGLPSSGRISIETPLVKSTKGGQLRMWPSREGDTRGVKVRSGVRKMRGNEAHSHVEVETTSAMTQITIDASKLQDLIASLTQSQGAKIHVPPALTNTAHARQAELNCKILNLLEKSKEDTSAVPKAIELLVQRNSLLSAAQGNPGIFEAFDKLSALQELSGSSGGGSLSIAALALLSGSSSGSSSGPVAKKSRHSSPPRSSQPSSSLFGNIQCSSCHGFGHKASTCRQFPYQK